MRFRIFIDVKAIRRVEGISNVKRVCWKEGYEAVGAKWSGICVAR